MPSRHVDPLSNDSEDAGATGSIASADARDSAPPLTFSNSTSPPSAEAPSNPANAASADEDSTSARQFEELTISEFLALMLRSPLGTWRRLRQAANPVHASPLAENRLRHPALFGDSSAQSIVSPSVDYARAFSGPYLQLIIYSAAILFAFVGSLFARETPAIAGDSLEFAAPYLWAGFLLWLAADVVGHLPKLKSHWRKCGRLERIRRAARVVPALIALAALHQLTQSMGAPRPQILELAGAAIGLLLVALLIFVIIEIVCRLAKRMPQFAVGTESGFGLQAGQTWIVDQYPQEIVAWRGMSRWRAIAMVSAALSSLYVWLNTTGNRIETATILVWLLSIGLSSVSFAPHRWNIFEWAADRVDAWRGLRLRERRLPLLALALVLLLGFQLRFSDLDSSPPQLISDHVENIKDSYRIRYDGYLPILFTDYNNREPLHQYLAVALSSLPGLEVDRYTFSLLSAIEGFLTLPLIFWLALELMGRRNRRFGRWYALCVAALVAVNLWHITMSRQGLRTTLCPLFMTWSFVFFARALRFNRRTDFVKAGLLLGFGLMSYQPMQMLPLIYLAGVVICLLIRGMFWHVSLRYLFNLAVLAICAISVFLPLLHVWMENPQQALMRQSQTIFGDAPMSNEERLDFLREDGLPALLSNFRLTALMFHHAGDKVWLSAVRDEPATDPLTAAFILLGVAAWLTKIISRRDAVLFLVPVALVFMLLVPSLALAHQNYSPHYMRALGSLCPIFLIAGLPLARYCWLMYLVLPQKLGALAVVCILAGCILYAYEYNSSKYFESYTEYYLARAQPHRQAGAILRGFAESDGSYGNAFALTYPHWWDSRAVGMEAGNARWSNAIPAAESLPHYLRSASERHDHLRLNPDRDLLFFYSQDDQAAPSVLSHWFPQGRPQRHNLEFDWKSFYSYRVPALGSAGLAEFLNQFA